MAAEDAAGDVVVVDGFYQHMLALKIVGQGVCPDEPLFFAGVNREDDGVAEVVLTEDAGQLHDEGGAGSVIPDTGGAAGDVAVVVVATVHMGFDDNKRLIGGLTSGEDGHDVV